MVNIKIEKELGIDRGDFVLESFCFIDDEMVDSVETYRLNEAAFCKAVEVSVLGEDYVNKEQAIQVIDKLIESLNTIKGALK